MTKMSMSPTQLDAVSDFIRANWDKSVHTAKPGETGIEPLPYPHTTPCMTGNFIAFFYWDTYFTNLGLLLQDRLDLAKGNCDDMIYLINLKGFIPNSTFRGDDTRSQPPYFSMMVRDLYEKTKDKTWLAQAVAALEKEYAFWMEKRLTPTHLNRHFHHASKEYLLHFYGVVVSRLGFDPNLPEEEKLAISANYLGEAETGWDFNPRFSGRCGDFNPVDLNSNLYVYEKNFAWFAWELGQGDASAWEAKAEQRRQLIQEHLWNEAQGLYFDFDYQAAAHSKVPSLATFHPLWAGLATPEQAKRIRDQLHLFEFEHGISVCAKTEHNKTFQWDYPNGWPPLFWTTISGLRRYGFTEDADRLAAKFQQLIVSHFERTGQLWEKFDVLTGKIAGGEYEAQPMLGWTAGTFLALTAKA
jgi:alpha,alpha-trehalase